MTDEKVVQTGAGGESQPKSTKQKTARTMVGKIARLPNAIREKINRRINNGERGSAILPWLNGLPVVKKILAAYFGGVAITDRNLSSWRTTGYKRWQEKQEFVSELKSLGEDATDFSKAAGVQLARGTASIAAAKIMKMLHAIPPDSCTPDELIKIAFAITGLVQAEQNNERLKNEKTRVYQGNERLVLSWDIHLRDCVATAQRVLNDVIAKEIQDSDIDNAEKIELLGHHLFGHKWTGREVGKEGEPGAATNGAGR
ncbi:MAG TPA: hypothetical protein VMH87_19740 [Pseudomonadales bacterium]|nr:hypothetical protein [Pseudomonadales bacterium]